MLLLDWHWLGCARCGIRSDDSEVSRRAMRGVVVQQDGLPRFPVCKDLCLRGHRPALVLTSREVCDPKGTRVTGRAQVIQAIPVRAGRHSTPAPAGLGRHATRMARIRTGRGSAHKLQAGETSLSESQVSPKTQDRSRRQPRTPSITGG